MMVWECAWPHRRFQGPFIGAELRRVPFCSPQKLRLKKLCDLNVKKCDKSTLIVVFYHKLIHIIVYVGVFKAYYVNIGKF